MMFILSTFDLDGLFWTTGMVQNDEMVVAYVLLFFFFFYHPHKKKQTINWVVSLQENSFIDSEAKNVLTIKI